MAKYISPYLMRRRHGWGPKGRTCGECISCVTDDLEEESVCTHEKSPNKPFVIAPEFPACGLFKSHWQHERELLEAQGQLTISFSSASSASPREEVSCV